MASRPSLLVLTFLLLPTRATADKLIITSNPPGATVEIEGVTAGVTPLEKDFPGGYFHKTRTALGSRLEHPLVVRVSLAGYATKEITITDGPMNWISLNGRSHGEYWLVKTNHFHVDLESVAETFTGGVTTAQSSPSTADFEPELSLEELVRRAKPAVVYLKGLDKFGTGFFVTETGVIATNAHVARGEETLLAILPSGQQMEGKVVYIDANLDIALAKVDARDLPHLTLASAGLVRQGENVLAIGNPGDAMLFSVTKGIVSAVGKFANAGPGTWIQTDTPINPGNSGGPLLNSRGEVIGINTQKLIKKNVTGIGFALSATDLLEVLRRFYPNIAPAGENSLRTAGSPAARGTLATATDPETPPAPASASSGARVFSQTSSSGASDGFGVVAITSEPDGADIFIDEKFVGSAPATLKLPSGPHSIVLKSPTHPDWRRTLEVLKSSRVALKCSFDTAQQ